MSQDFIIRTIAQYHIGEFESVDAIMLNSDNPLQDLLDFHDVRRGDIVTFVEKVEKVFPFPSRFWHLQPDGSNKKIAWCAKGDVEPEYTVLNTWKWTGKRWKEI